MNRLVKYTAMLAPALIVALLCIGHEVKAADVSSKDTWRAAPVAAPAPIAEPNPFAGIYGGVSVGAQFMDITITEPRSDDYISGISADGINWGAHLGFNLCPGNGRFCFGPEAEFAFSDVAVHLGDAGDVLEMDDYLQLVAKLSTLVGKSTLLDVHAGYEWQWWTAGIAGSDRTDITIEAGVIGVGIETFVTQQITVGLSLDYLIFTGIDVDGLSGAENDFVEDLLEDTDGLRAKVKTTWHPAAQPSLSSLDNFRF